MSGFDKKETGEGFEEVLISQSTDEEDQTVTVTATEQIAPVEAVNISKYEDDDEEEGSTSSMDNIVPVSQVSNGWNVMSGMVWYSIVCCACLACLACSACLACLACFL
jgi:hypothetical protein